MEIIKSHKWRTDNSGNLIANIFLHLFLPVGIVIAPIVGGIPYWVIKDYVPDLFIVAMPECSTSCNRWNLEA